MSSASSVVTYTSVNTDSEPGRVFWGADEELSDGGSLRVSVYGYDELPMLPVAPPSLDYIPSPEEPQTPPTPQDKDEHEPMFVQPHDPDFVPEPIYPESRRRSEEYEDDETEDGLVDYPMGGGDDGDDDDGDSSGDEDDDEDEEEEGEEHLALADSAVVIPTDELVSPPEGTEPAVISFPPEAEVERLLAMPTPSPSPLTSLPLPLHMPPPVDHRDDILETEMPPRKRLCLSTLGSREVGYGFRDTWVDPTETVPEIAPMTRVDLLMEDRIADQETIQIMEDEAYAAREAWAHSIGLSQAVYSELQTHQEQVQMAETLRVMGDMRREMDDMEAELLALREQPRRARQARGDAKVLNHEDAPRDADSHI
nr:hypothetical protein [Tanacetum cinerariifolium]